MNSFPLSCFFWKFSNLQKCRDAQKLYLELGNQLYVFLSLLHIFCLWMQTQFFRTS